MSKTAASLLFALGLLAAAAQAAAAQVAPPAPAPFSFDDLVRLRRLSDPQVSPDGRYVAYVLSETDMQANKRRTDLWLLDLSVKNGEPRRLTTNPADDTNPRWAPDGHSLYFISTRSGSAQVWRLPTGGGEALQVTRYPLDIGTLEVAPDGDRIAVSMDVMPDCPTLECTRQKLDAIRDSKASARIYDRLFIRHWDTWRDGTRSHLFVARIDSQGGAAVPVDISKSLDADVPSKPFGGGEEWAFSPDGTRIVFAARIAGKSEPWSTNFDLFEAPVDGSSAPQNLTAANLAWDTQPVFLRNGDLAYLAQDRPGVESDRFHIVVRDARTAVARPLTQSWDRSVNRLGVSRDGRKLLATADDVGQEALFAVDPKSGAVTKLIANGQVTEYAAAKDSIVYAWATLGAPVDLYLTRAAGGEPRRLTAVNKDVLEARGLGEFEQWSFTGWNGETVYGYVVKPVGFVPGRRYPVAFIVHGGPQSSFQNQWTYRWNAQAFAGRGYAVVAIDFHGSPGYGQAFTDSISKDWGGKPLVDLQKGLASATARFPWLDSDRVCALGASYGGYMMNWIAGKWPDRFRCLVVHDGVFDQRMMYYSTDELWFAEWENGGTYYDNPAGFEKFNPANLVANWRTPALVIHGEQDFRIPVSQGIAVFTALQRRGIESKLVIFPNENHWVLKPADSVLWYGTVLDWLDAHLKN